MTAGLGLLKSSLETGKEAISEKIETL